MEALYNQYDAEDFELGIKQFMIEQAIQQVRCLSHARACHGSSVDQKCSMCYNSQDLEDGMDKKGGNADFEEKLAEALFAEEDNEKGIKDTLKTEDVAPDAFTTEVGGPLVFHAYLDTKDNDVMYGEGKSVT